MKDDRRTEDELNIGEFARRAGLSPKALRLYDELGLVAPARVDGRSGYRFYLNGQLSRARLVAQLRQVGLPLADIAAILELPPAEAADRLEEYEARAQAELDARRQLALSLIARLRGKEPTMTSVATRTMPERHLLCLKRHVPDEAAAWALGKEFLALLRERSLPTLEGMAGATFVIYHGLVNDDSDGPLEWCRPVPSTDAGALAVTLPELTLRVEPAHDEAYVDLGPALAVPPARWQTLGEELRSWAQSEGRQPGDLGVRITYVARPPVDTERGPDCDFAVPLA